MNLTLNIKTETVKMLTTINYNDGCEKTIKISKYYDRKTPDIYKTVEFRYPNGTIDEDRSYDCRLITDKSDESDPDYIN